MIFLDYIDLYCERTAPGFWNEPLNAISNASFLIAAWIAWRVLKNLNQRRVIDKILIALAASIGVGSFLFHTFANGKTEMLDVIPIWTFVTLYVSATIYRMTGGNVMKTLRIYLYTICGIGVGVWATSGDIITSDTTGPTFLNGSLQYLPALMALAAFSLITLIRRHPASLLVTTATVCFMLSLGFRSIDIMTCAQTGIGTHFLWHILNGAMVLALLLAFIRHVPPTSEPCR